MNHASRLALHNHAFGFVPSDHVAGCAECRAQADRLLAEASVLREVLAEEPVSVPSDLLHAPVPRRRRVTAGGLAAAAILLGSLAWVLTHHPESGPSDKTAANRHLSQEAQIERLIAEARSPSGSRREIAILALKAYGEAALGAIARSGLDPGLFGDYRLKASDEELTRRLKAEKMDLDFENALLDDIFASISQKTGVKIALDPALRSRLDPKQKVTFKVKDLTVWNLLKLLLSQEEADFRCEEGSIAVWDARNGKVSAPVPARAPVRIGKNKAAAVELLAEFRSDSVDRRTAARQALMRLGFAGEEALWEALGSQDRETQGQAKDLLSWLYSPEESSLALSYPNTRQIRKQLYSKRVTVDFSEATVVQAADFLREHSGTSLHLSGIDPESAVSLSGTDLPVYSALLLLVEPRQMLCRITPEVVLITTDLTPSEAAPRWVGNFWTTPAEAKELEEALGDLAGGVAATRDRAAAALFARGDRMLPLLERAAEILEGAAAERCRGLRETLRKKLDPEGLDEAPASDRAKRDAKEQELLQRTASLDVDGVALDQVLKPYGVGVEVMAAPDQKFRLKAQNVRLETALKALTAPFGLDYALKDGGVIVDRADRIRALAR
jgi:hypothetical protein